MGEAEDSMDLLTSALEGSMQVDPDGMGMHPHFSAKYKNTSKLADAQASRRAAALERQRCGREDLHNRIRKIVDNEPFDEDEEVDEEDKSMDTQSPVEWKKRAQTVRYRGQLMTSEWLVDIPEELSSDWTMMASPVGRRCLVVARNKITSVYKKTGELLTQFVSGLPGGGKSNHGQCTILDCIMEPHPKNVLWCLDVLSWNGMLCSDNDFLFRHFFLTSRLEENPGLRKSSAKCKFTFRDAPTCPCIKEKMEEFMQQKFDFDLDGLLFYYSEGFYVAGQTPLVGWLKPFMLTPELGVAVPSTYNFNAGGKNTSQFIAEFNEKHKHKSLVDAKPEDNGVKKGEEEEMN
ncbi:unnamed protein product, partial [Mesorhabditis spiculigera]